MKIRDRIKSFRRVKASELLPNPRNWRQHPPAQRDAMCGILAEIGIADAVLARETPAGLMLIDGHLRAEVAPDAKLPVLVLDVSEEEADKILLTHDTITELAEADPARLKSLLDAAEFECESLEQMLADYLDENEGDAASAYQPSEADDALPDTSGEELLAKWQVKPGDVYDVTGESGLVHRVMCGDAMGDDVGKLFGPLRARLVFTSPPYNQRVGKFSKSGMHRETKWVDNTNAGSYPDDLSEDVYQAQQATIVASLESVLTDDGSVFYNHKNRFRNKQVVSPWLWLEQSGAKVRQEIIWKREGSVTQNMRGFMPVDERIFWLYFSDDFYFDDRTEHKTWSTVWEVNSHKDREQSQHGCAFPVELPFRAICACSCAGDCVYDPFLGSGTTIVAAERTKRRGFGMEISPQYVAVTLERLTMLGMQVAKQTPAAEPKATAKRGNSLAKTAR